MFRVVVIRKQKLLFRSLAFFSWCDVWMDLLQIIFTLIKIYTSIYADIESKIVVQASHDLFLSFFEYIIFQFYKYQLFIVSYMFIIYVVFCSFIS